MITWLASYPRSGNTYLRIILNKLFNTNTFSLYNDLNSISAHKQTEMIVGHKYLPQNTSFDALRDASTTYFIKTHTYPENNFDKAIYIIRDGRDSITSYYFYRKEYNFAPPLIDFIEGKIKVGLWSHHIAAWQTIEKNNLLIIRFEELIKNNPQVIQALSSFIGLYPVNSLTPSFAELHKINPSFFRSGKSNGYSELFSNDDHLRFWELNYNKMIEFDYTENIPALYKV